MLERAGKEQVTNKRLIQTSPAGLGDLDLLSFTPFVDGDDGSGSAIRCIEGEHLTSTYGSVVLPPSMNVKELVMARNVVNVYDTHF